jgi:hypothetical protein
MLFNDTLLLEILLISVVSFYVVSINLLTLFYTAGLYLILIGVFCFLNDADIYIGFLWVIDLGVGLIFFIFILHFTSFLFQKSQFNLTSKYFVTIYMCVLLVLTIFYFFSGPNDATFFNDLSKSWFFKISYLDYYHILFSYEVAELNTLKNTYFFLNSFEFFIVNFSLLYGLLTAILLCFLVHRIFNFLNFSQVYNLQLLNNTTSGFIIRNQNFLKQQQTSPTVHVWNHSKLN